MVMKTRPKAYRYAENLTLAAIILITGMLYLAEAEKEGVISCSYVEAQ